MAGPFSLKQGGKQARECGKGGIFERKRAFGDRKPGQVPEETGHNRGYRGIALGRPNASLAAGSVVDRYGDVFHGFAVRWGGAIIRRALHFPLCAGSAKFYAKRIRRGAKERVGCKSGASEVRQLWNRYS